MNAAEITDKLGLHSLRQRAWVLLPISVHPTKVVNLSLFHSTSNLPAPPPETVSMRVWNGSAPTLGSAASHRGFGTGFAVVKGWACFLLFVSVPLVVVCESRLCLPSTTLSYCPPTHAHEHLVTLSVFQKPISYTWLLVFLFDVYVWMLERSRPFFSSCKQGALQRVGMPYVKRYD
jgi:hypothetical protein